MNKTILLVFMLLAFCFSAFAQDFEYGKPSDLKGLKKIFLDTSADLKNRERIIKEIEKANLGVEFVDEPDSAEIFMVFRGEINEVTTGASTYTIGNSVITNINNEKLAAGTGIVTIKGRTKPRLLMNVQNSQDTKLEKKPSVKFAREFVKQYKIANAL